ncbi:MAG: dolichyl-phosphate beta-glucosyltransferase [Candidatus Dormibacteria bacterium]
MLSVIVPALNEAARLPSTLAVIREFLEAQGEEYEVIVADDGSTDSSADSAERISQGWPQLRVIRLGRHQGKGAAVRAGMLTARGDLRLFSDADLSTPIHELARLRRRIGGTCQIAIASRALPQSDVQIHQSRRREFMGRSYNVLLRILVLPGLHDTQCGFKLFTAQAAVACFQPLETSGFGFDAEILLRARRRGWTVAEVPVVWRHAADSRVSPLRDSLTTFRDLVRLRLRRP